MGNTGVALAEDGAAPFLNPATIVRINDQSLAFSVNFFAFGATHLSGWHQPGRVDPSRFGNVALNDTSIDTNGFNVLPSTLCLFFTIAGVTADGEPNGVLHKGRQKLAVCLGSLEATNLNLGALSFNGSIPGGTTTQVQSFSSNWNRLYVGPTYSVSLSDQFAIGLSLHGVATNDTFAVEGSSLSSTAATSSIQSSLGSSGNGHAVSSSTARTSSRSRARSRRRSSPRPPPRAARASPPARSPAPMRSPPDPCSTPRRGQNTFSRPGSASSAA